MTDAMKAVILDLEEKYVINIVCVNQIRADVHSNQFLFAFLDEEGMHWGGLSNKIAIAFYEDPDFFEKIYHHVEKYCHGRYFGSGYY